jgi:septum formation protein
LRLSSLMRTVFAAICGLAMVAVLVVLAMRREVVDRTCSAATSAPYCRTILRMLILASASPRRLELLRAGGIHAEVRPADVDESVHAGEPAEVYACRLAREKALAVSPGVPDGFVLGGDTVVVVDGLILGKPSNALDAARMLRLLSGRRHDVITGVALVTPDRPSGRHVDSRAETTAVEFARLSEREIEWYVASGEPIDKAGGYAIQGLASRFVTRVEGSYTNVVGLPIALVYEMCTRAGLLLS